MLVVTISTVRSLGRMPALIRGLAATLPTIVAEALDVPENPDCTFKPSDVNVRLRKADLFDINPPSLGIVIEAPSFPEGNKSYAMRLAEIGEKIEKVLSTPEAHGKRWTEFLSPPHGGTYLVLRTPEREVRRNIALP